MVVIFMNVASTTDGIDYILASTGLSFPVGSQIGDLQCTIVNITDDTVVEGRELFYVGLTANDTRIEIFTLRGQQVLSWFCIHDNDSKFFV